MLGIERKNRFDTKSMAGNIVPAIATTNAVVAGLVVTEALKILNGRIEDCKVLFTGGAGANKYISSGVIYSPNKKVCSCQRLMKLIKGSVPKL